jgi:hypothetical protein
VGFPHEGCKLSIVANELRCKSPENVAAVILAAALVVTEVIQYY